MTQRTWTLPQIFFTEDFFLKKKGLEGAGGIFIQKTSEAATRDVLEKKVIFKNFTIFTGKQLCWSLFLLKLQA